MSAEKPSNQPYSEKVSPDETSENSESLSLSVEQQDDSVAEAYAEYQQPPEVVDYNERKQEYRDALTMWDTYIQNAVAEDGHTLSEEELLSALDMRERTKQEMIEVSANYPGDWTLLLYERMSDPISREKFIAQRQAAMSAMKDGEIGMLDKPKQFKQHYQDQIDEYDRTLNRVFKQTNVSNDRPHVLGTSSGIGNPGTVFTGAYQKDSTPLTSRQMNIIEAHEKGHSLRDFESPIDSSEVRTVIDEDALQLLTDERRSESDSLFSSNYLREPAEIIERMAQFKNYFGMGAQEEFTKNHLDQIRKKYVTDVGLDNSVSDLLRCVTPQTEAAFLKVINEYPI